MRIAVVGAGLQGSSIALDLAHRGVRVDLYERNDQCMAEASALNEGKIHLGFVYAADETLATARLMLQGALSFERLIRFWCGNEVDQLPVSHPFYYAVHPDSLLTPDAFAQYANRVTFLVRELSRTMPVTYFGRDPGEAIERVSPQCFPGQSNAKITAAFRTSEIALDPLFLADLVRNSLATMSSIRCLTGRTVTRLDARTDEIRLTSEGGGTRELESYDFVVNAAWAGRLPLDVQLGLHPERPSSFRFKYFLRGKLGVDVQAPSATIVLGPFGDVVNYGNGTVYLSWYPIGLRQWSFDQEPPKLSRALAGNERVAMKRGILDGLSLPLPFVSRFAISSEEVTGAWIFAEGTTDIHDRRSALHKRSNVGVRRLGRYVTVDTGKLTLAPLFARQVTEMLLR